MTGAGSGIGRALAEALAAGGAFVVLAGTRPEPLEAVRDGIVSRGGQASAHPTDVSDRSSVFELADRTLAERGQVDLLCSNAGVRTFQPYLAHRADDWRWVYDVVLMGVVHGIEAFYPAMVERRRGQIMNVGSMMGLVPDWMLDHGPYSSAKAAVVALSLSLRLEAEAHGVGVSVLIPGAVRTPRDSEGSRPSRYGAPRPEAQGRPHARPGVPLGEAAKDMVLEPEEAARIALDGLERGDAVIATHPGLKPIVEDFYERMLAAFDPVRRGDS